MEMLGEADMCINGRGEMQSRIRVPAAGSRVVGVGSNIPHTHSALLPQQVEAFSVMVATARCFFLGGLLAVWEWRLMAGWM